ncbi:MAG: hypothetical protein HC780_04820 [Leptolyngbyaceae cyanobacterium CSU_1_3]|nr:hypothetical protein [Leptolyngbyaceae cyanobacterium CSU_1_3]
MKGITLLGSHEPSWLQSSVQEFFKTCNWEDQSIAVQAIKFASLLDENTALELTLSVGQFFAAVNWDGSTFSSPAAAIEEPEAIDLKPSSDETFTLTDFSDLFS